MSHETAGLGGGHKGFGASWRRVISTTHWWTGVAVTLKKKAFPSRVCEEEPGSQTLRISGGSGSSRDPEGVFQAPSPPVCMPTLMSQRLKE